MYFENVGGIHFEAAMETLTKYGRVAVCGAIDAYNEGTPVPLKLYPMSLIYNAQRVEGFISGKWFY